MLRSLMTAVSGVKAHQTLLDVTGNNIANVNTTGFKRDFTIFQDILYQTTRASSGPGDNLGGINASQVGLGVRVGAIETIQTQGGAQATGGKSDMMISGEGFFVLNDQNGSNIYSRAGNFVLDAESTLVHSGTGYIVQGYKMERDPQNPLLFVKDAGLSDIVIPIGQKMDARATTVVGYKCNLDSRMGPYLPIGFADIEFTDYYSTYGGGGGEPATIKIEGISYETTFKTNLGTTGTDGTDYLTITLDAGSTGAGQIVFDMIGIENGLPILSIGATNLSAGGTNTVFLNGTNPPTEVEIVYDDKSGRLKLVGMTPSTGPGSLGNLGVTLWETNLKESMSYTSFSFTDRTAQPSFKYDFIAEFDETYLNGSPTELTLWYPDNINVGSTAMVPLKATVSFKADGTFDTVSDIRGTLPTVGGSGTPPTGGYILTTDQFKIVPTDDGTGLQIRLAKDLSTAPIVGADLTNYDVLSTISQGGYHQTKLTVYDCQGFPYTMELQFKKLTSNRWRWEVFFPDYPSLAPTPNSGELTFDSSCHIVDPIPTDIYVPFSLLGRDNSTITLDFSGETFGLDTIDGVTQFASATTSKGYYQDGYTMGVMNDYSVSKDGTITGVYTNGVKQPIYRVALAQFTNPQGLEKIGDTMFQESINSGRANIDAALDNGKGSIESGYLEMSNVDLTEEFTRLIVAQRGFQANTRVITTSDQILEEVVNLKR
ncbi:flagellar hook protein FlgE [Synergistales bacterium]|nr:flagellar hook protein FlgE [Synergistales bacterium]